MNLILIIKSKSLTISERKVFSLFKMSNKKEVIQFRLGSDLKKELDYIADKVGLNVSEYLRNEIGKLVNRKDKLIKIVEEYETLHNDVEMFLDEDTETEIKSSKSKDEIIYHCDNCRSGVHTLKYTRKSDKFQSHFNIKKFGRSMLNCGEMLYLSVGSSSFYDTSFIRAIIYSSKLGIKEIEVLALTRSEYETITRSIIIADRVVKQLIAHHISLKNMDIMMLRIACVMYQNNQVRRMNTQYSLKTRLFWIALNHGIDKAEWFYNYHKEKGYKKFNDRSFQTYNREYEALYELNNLNKDKFRFHLIYLLCS